MLTLKTNWKSNDEFALQRKNDLFNESNDFKYGRLFDAPNRHENTPGLACCRMRLEEQASCPTGGHPTSDNFGQLMRQPSLSQVQSSSQAQPRSTDSPSQYTAQSLRGKHPLWGGSRGKVGRPVRRL